MKQEKSALFRSVLLFLKKEEHLSLANPSENVALSGDKLTASKEWNGLQALLDAVAKTLPVCTFQLTCISPIFDFLVILNILLLSLYSFPCHPLSSSLCSAIGSAT
jgi:hypothetical protein